MDFGHVLVAMGGAVVGFIVMSLLTVSRHQSLQEEIEMLLLRLENLREENACLHQELAKQKRPRILDALGNAGITGMGAAGASCSSGSSSETEAAPENNAQTT